MIEKLQEQLRAIIADYSDSSIVKDDDVAKFLNIITDYDNEQQTNSSIYDAFMELGFIDLDGVQDVASRSDINSLYNLTCELNDLDAEYYFLDDWCSLKNITKEDLSDFIDDLDYAK